MRSIINYKEHCKLRIISSDDSRTQHEVVKLLVMMISKQKHPKAGIYSEYPLSNGQIVDVMIDLGSEQIYYEIQKEVGSEWLESIKQRDLELHLDTIVINLKELSDNIPELTKQLKNLIV